ncbi:MAG: zinc ABC transporter substrate-binding protein [Planctomycetota bacterium]|nr:zinc ABC transporter substrate-binding protein [Planctomycetota bacterium]
MTSFLGGCAEPGSATRGQLVCTTPFVGDLVNFLARGQGIQASSLMGPGVDPHLYRPTASDVARLMSATAIFVVGLGLEGKMGETLSRAASTGRPVIALGDAIPHADLFAVGDESDSGNGTSAPSDVANTGRSHAAWDPHVWMDPALWSICTARAATGVIESLELGATSATSATSATTANANANATTTAAAASAIVHTQAHLYQQRLAALRAWGIERTATISPERRVIITSHDAFHYFGRAFGFEVFGIQGVSTESEAGLDDVRRLVDLIVQRKIPAVFAESSVADKSVQALIEGAAARGHTVKLGGTLYADSLGDPGTHEGTYIGMIDHDITTIVTALGGDVHPLGHDGSLSRPATA